MSLQLSALPAFDQVDHVPSLQVYTGSCSCSMYVEGLVGGCAPNIGARLDVAADEAVYGTTRTGWLESESFLYLSLGHTTGTRTRKFEMTLPLCMHPCYHGYRISYS